jgi:hypothetical protein
MRAPREWQSQPPSSEQLEAFQKQVRGTAIAFAAKAREFVERFPTNENVGDARITVVHALNHAVAAGDADAERQMDQFVSMVRTNTAIPEDDRVGVVLYAGNAHFMKRVGMRYFTEGPRKLAEEFETASIENLRAVVKRISDEQHGLHTAPGYCSALNR